MHLTVDVEIFSLLGVTHMETTLQNKGPVILNGLVKNCILTDGSKSLEFSATKGSEG